MDGSRIEELASVVAAAHASSLAREVERYLSAVFTFDAEGAAPFGALRARAALERELEPVAVAVAG